MKLTNRLKRDNIFLSFFLIDFVKFSKKVDSKTWLKLRVIQI